MSETEELLSRIVALRQRLEQTRSLSEAADTALALLGDSPPPARTLHNLERSLAQGSEHDTLLDSAVRPATAVIPDDLRPLPRVLTSRARRVLENARQLLGRLRILSDAFASPYKDPSGPDDDSRLPLLDYGDPLSRFYRETAAITDTALRMIPLFPDTATAQLHLCEGLEGILAVVAVRLQTLEAAVEQHRHETELVSRLAVLLASLEAGQLKSVQPFLELAAEIHTEAEEFGALRFLACDTTRPAHLVAAHSLNTARVIARVVRYDLTLKQRAPDAIVAALVHDVGMLRLPPAILCQPGPLDDEQRRLVEGHCRIGAQLVAPLQTEGGWLAEAAAGHHERLDGTGYPDGLRQHQLSSLTRLLAVCDIYAGSVTTRPWRQALETRTALADTLLLADQGQLDRQHAQHLLQLSFYPVGSAVEMENGAIGVVVATPILTRDLNAPSRPVVALLLDGDGQPLPLPHHLDLAHCDHHSVVRTLSPRERRERLGQRFPEWVA